MVEVNDAGEADAVRRPAPGQRFVSRVTRDALALVMAGGRGSRLRELTAHTAKPAVPFAGKYRIIDFTLSNCINSGVRRVGVLTQYKSHGLIRHLQQGWGFLRGQFGEFIELLPAQQRSELSSWYSGTADAVYQNLDFILTHQPAHILVLAGDHIYKMDYGAMLAGHVAAGAAVTVGCLEVPIAEARDFGVLAVDTSGRVVEFAEKPVHPKPIPGRPDTALASMGIYVFDARFLLELLTRDAGIRESSHDFGHDVIPDAIATAHVHTWPFRDLYRPDRQGYWRDVGTVDAYWRSNLELADLLPELDLYDEHWPVWTRQQQVPPAKFVLDASGARGHAMDSLVSGGCIVTGAEIRHSVLFENARVETGTVVEHSLLLPGVRVGRDCRIVNAVIDEGCVIPDATHIGGPPPPSGPRPYYVSPGGVTLVTREMLA